MLSPKALFPLNKFSRLRYSRVVSNANLNFVDEILRYLFPLISVTVGTNFILISTLSVDFENIDSDYNLIIRVSFYLGSNLLFHHP